MATDSPGEVPSDPSQPHRRRVRYKGTHPRRFEERYKELDPTAHPELLDHVRSQGRTPAGTHVPVLMKELLEVLAIRPGAAVADCTLGFGGHALEIIKRIVPGGHFVGLDLDGGELKKTTERLQREFSKGNEATQGETEAASLRLSFHRSHFAGLAKAMKSEGLNGFDAVYADLGVSSMQIDDPLRGFSYKHDGPLDMRMDDRLTRKAADVLASLTEDEFRRALIELADESKAGRIAEVVMRNRARQPINSTRQLVDLVFEAKGISRRSWRERPPEQKGALHPAAKTFQALRMMVNDEVAGLAQFLRVVPHCLRPRGRVAVISFHSGEDARVASAFQEGMECGTFSEVSDIPTVPSTGEVAANPRSRSALMRWAVKAGA